MFPEILVWNDYGRWNILMHGERKEICYQTMKRFLLKRSIGFQLINWIGQLPDSFVKFATTVANLFDQRHKELILQLQQAINWKLKHENYHFLQDGWFKQIAGCLNSVMGRSAKQGLNVPTKRAEILLSEHEDILWKKNVWGSDSPDQLLTTLLFTVELSFALRAGGCLPPLESP